MRPRHPRRILVKRVAPHQAAADASEHATAADHALAGETFASRLTAATQGAAELAIRDLDFHAAARLDDRPFTAHLVEAGDPAEDYVVARFKPARRDARLHEAPQALLEGGITRATASLVAMLSAHLQNTPDDLRRQFVSAA